MTRINAGWHALHPMPGNATLEQRIEWHLAHAKACRCREMPKSLVAELRKRGIAVEGPREPRGTQP